MTAKKLPRVAKAGDYRETLVALRDELADAIAESNSGRDIAALSRQLVSVLEKIESMDGNPSKRSSAGGEVTPFAVVSKRSSERREAAQG